MSTCNSYDPRCSNCGAPLTEGEPAPHPDGERCILCRARKTFRAPAAAMGSRDASPFTQRRSDAVKL